MAGNALIDTGAIVALLDHREAMHRPCMEAIRTLRLPLITSEAVLTESFHLIKRYRPYADGLWRLVRGGLIEVRPILHSELARLEFLMSQYQDRPMDFADATLVYLAEREAVSDVMTIDRNDFATYRIHGRKRFRVLPG